MNKTVADCAATYSKNMEGYPLLLRNYVVVMGIFATFPSISTGDAPTCVRVVCIFSSLGPLEHIFSTFLKLSFFFLLFPYSFQSRIDWQLFLRQLHDKWIFLPEYHKYWTESYSRRKRLWLRLFRKFLMFFLQCGCLPWCQRQTSLRTPAIGQV